LGSCKCTVPKDHSNTTDFKPTFFTNPSPFHSTVFTDSTGTALNTALLLNRFSSFLVPYVECCRAIDIEGDQKTPGKEILRKKCGQRVSGTAGGRWRRKHRTELDGDK